MKGELMMTLARQQPAPKVSPSMKGSLMRQCHLYGSSASSFALSTSVYFMKLNQNKIIINQYNTIFYTVQVYKCETIRSYKFTIAQIQMQTLAFQVNQVVLVQNNDIPYHYDLARIIQRTKNQDQAYQYEIKLYKQTHSFQSKPIDAFKIRKVDVKIFYQLKQKCQQFPELAQSFRSIEFELSKSQVLIDKQQRNKFWIKLFKNSILALQAKKSARLKSRVNTLIQRDQAIFCKDKGKFKNTSSNENGIILINQRHFQSVKRRSFKRLKSNLLENSFNKVIQKSNSKKNLQLNSNSKPKSDSKSKTKTKPPSSQKCIAKIANENLINERYKCLFLFGLEYIASQQKIQKIKNYFSQASLNCVFDLQRQSQDLQNYLDQLKKLLFSLHFGQNQMQVKIAQLQKHLSIKLKQFMHSDFTIFPQSVTEKVILVIKIYLLKPIVSMKSIITTLKIWLKVFLQKMDSINMAQNKFNIAYTQFKHTAEQVLIFNFLE